LNPGPPEYEAGKLIVEKTMVKDGSGFKRETYEVSHNVWNREKDRDFTILEPF
jgi:hypothetical protein